MRVTSTAPPCAPSTARGLLSMLTRSTVCDRELPSLSAVALVCATQTETLQRPPVVNTCWPRQALLSRGIVYLGEGGQGVTPENELENGRALAGGEVALKSCHGREHALRWVSPAAMQPSACSALTRVTELSPSA